MTSNNDHFIEKTVSSKLLHQGKSFAFYSDKVTLPDGREAQRDYVRYPEAVAILPVLDDGRILLIRQFRYSIGKTLLEVPAGKIDDPKEAMEKAAYRELEEETGYSATRLSYLFSHYPAVGYSSETIHSFIATGLKKTATHFDEDEFIEIAPYDKKDVESFVQKGEIMDAKTLLLIQYAQKHIWNKE